MNKSSVTPVYQHMVASKKGLLWLGVLLGLAIGSAQAQTTNSYTNTVGGQFWGTTSSWSLGTPTATQDVYVTNGVDVRINSAAVASNLFIGGASGTSTVQLRRDGTRSLTVGGNITMGSGAGTASLQLGVSSGGTSTLTIGGGTGSILDGGGAGATTIEVYGPTTLNLQTVTVDNLNISQNSAGSMTISTNQTWNITTTRIGQVITNVAYDLTVAGTLNSTTINVGDAGILGTNNATLNLNSGGLIRATTLQRNGAMSSAFNWNDGTIQNRSGANLAVQGSGTNILTISLAGTGTHTFNADSGRTITVASTAVLADKAGEQGTLVKAGAGTLNIQSTNTYTGGTTVLDGTMNVTGVLADSGAVTVNGASAIYTVGANDTVGAVTLKSGTINGSGTLTGSSYTVESGLISAALSGNGVLTKSTAGQATLSGSNSFTGGVVVSDGTLTLQNTGNSFTGGVMVNGGTLKSSGNSAGNTIVVNSGGTLAMAGTDTWGGATTNSTPAITLNAGGTMTSDGFFNSIRDLTLNGGTVSLNGGTAAQSSALVLGGTVTAGGATNSTIAVASGSNNAIRLGRQGTSESTTFDVPDANGQLSVGTVLDNNFGSVSGLTKAGSGKMVLSASNTYTGPTAVTAGTLQVGNGGTTGSISANSALSVSNGATLAFNRTDNYGGALTHTISGAGTVAINGGNLTLNAAGSSGYSTNLTFTINNGATATMGHSDMFGGTGWDATTSPGFTVNAGGTLASANNFNTLWNLNLNGGTLLANGGANGPAQAFALAGTVNVGGSSASLIQSGTNGNGLNNINISGNGNSTLTFNVADVTGNANADLTVAANLQNSRSALSNLNKTGSGTMVLAGSNSYTGSTTVSGGTLELANGGSVQGNITNNATLSINRTDSSTLGNVVSGSGALVKSGSGTTALTAASTYTGGTTINAGALELANGGSVQGNITNNATLSINRTDTSTLGNVVSGSGALTKSGSGTATLTASNTYSGATAVNAGVLQVASGGSIASSSTSVNNGGTLDVAGRAGNVTVNSGGTLKGSGTVSALTIASGGTLAVGNSTGILNSGSTSFLGGGNYDWEIDTFGGGVVGTNWDFLNITGDLTISASSGSQFIIDVISLLSTNDTVGLASNFNDGTNYTFAIATASGAINGYAADAFSINTAAFQNSFTGTWGTSLSNDGKSLNLTYTAATAIPEPSSVSLAVLGLGVLALRRRRAR